jgi:tripartite-type tricarboxylate transporter receptor subunit TctC
MRMHVHLLGVVVSMLAIISEYSSAASPQPFPARPVRFILGYPPGGSSDAVARVLASSVGARMRQNVVIDNRPGAGGNIAAEIAAQQAQYRAQWQAQPWRDRE